MTGQAPLRISLWSGPRNVSTALMYAFAQRQDTQVWDEPLYAHYLARRPQVQDVHPGANDILKSQDNDGRRVIDKVLFGDAGKPVLFFKNMAHHLVDLDFGFLGQLTNVLLTREPRDMLISYSKTISRFGMDDVGYLKLKSIADAILKSGQTPMVLDSQILLRNPERILGELCRRIGLPFDSAMLSWVAGPRPEDGVWAPHWYQGVHCSTGFQPYVTKKEEPFPDKLQPLLKECQELYDSLMRFVVE